MLMGTILWKAFKSLKLFKLITKQWKYLVVLEEETKTNVNWFERNSAKMSKVREYFINPKIQNEDIG